MKTTRPETVIHPKLYQNFKNSREIGEVINRSESYVKKALRHGFTDREKELLNKSKNRDLFD